VNRSKRLAALAVLADRREQAAAGILRRRRTEMEDHRTTLGQLLQYQQDYLGYLRSGAHRVLKSHEMKNLQGFMDHLEIAIHLVGERVHAASGACDQQLRDWMRTRSRARAVHSVIDRQRVEAARRESRHEQLEADDRNGCAAKTRRG